MLLTTSDLSYFMRCRKWLPFGKDVPSVLLRVRDTKQSSADWLWLRMEIPIRCHRENLQGSTSLHFVGSHNGNDFRVAHLQDGQNIGLRGLSEEYIWDDLLELILFLGDLVGKVLKTIGASWFNSFCTCKGTADGRNIKCRWSFWTENFPAAFHNLYQIGYSVKFSVLTLALFSPVSAVRECT